jgi:hypothetical protein
VAAKASTRTIGDVFVQLMLTILNPIAGSTYRVLDGPTNLVWIDPWRTYLESSGFVQYVTEAEVEEILRDKGQITGVAIRQQGKRSVVRGDYYMAALPYRRRRRTRLPREVLRLHQIISGGGGIRWAQQVAAAFAEAAVHEFDTSAFAGVPASADLEWLRACVDYLLRRDG